MRTRRMFHADNDDDRLFLHDLLPTQHQCQRDLKTRSPCPLPVAAEVDRAEARTCPCPQPQCRPPFLFVLEHKDLVSAALQPAELNTAEH